MLSFLQNCLSSERYITKMVILSIILPCYNVSKYISRCLDSIYACEISLEEYEVICVDDCSTDNTPHIISLYAEKFVNLQYIRHLSNKASGGARNTGLLAAKGEYIWYIDPDDMIYPRHVPDLLRSCLNNNLDVLCFNYEDIDEQEHILSRPKVFNDTSVMKGAEFAHKCFGSGFIYHIGYVVRFMYRRLFILENCIFFPENTCWQDTAYMPKAILLADRIQGCSLYVYRYWHHDTSVCGSFRIGYSGRKIYQWAFNAGYYVLQLSEEIKKVDNHYSNLFYSYARTHYFNQLPIFLCRTSASQRNIFYQQVELNPDRVKEVTPFMNPLSRLLLRPILGQYCAHALSVLYNIKHYIIKK